MTGLPLQALFQCSLLGERVRIGVEDVEHPWMERLHHAQGLGRDCFIILPRSNRLVPDNIGLKECMTMSRMHKKSTEPYTAFSNGHFDFPINFRIASLPGLAEAAPLVAAQAVAHVARTSGVVALDKEQVVGVPDHNLLRQARDGRVGSRVWVPWMGVQLHLQLPPKIVVTRLRQPCSNFEPPPLIQPTSLLQQPRPHIRCTIPVARWGLLSLPHHFGEIVAELHRDAPICAFIETGAHIASLVFQSRVSMRVPARHQ